MALSVPLTWARRVPEPELKRTAAVVPAALRTAALAPADMPVRELRVAALSVPLPA
jgi:hypothetical protein